MPRPAPHDDELDATVARWIDGLREGDPASANGLWQRYFRRLVRAAEGRIAPALERSSEWTRSRHAAQFFPITGITHERALASLERFADLLEVTRSPEDFARRYEEDFTDYKSAGWAGAGGGVLFTGYCTPILPGSLTRGGPYQPALPALPPSGGDRRCVVRGLGSAQGL